MSDIKGLCRRNAPTIAVELFAHWPFIQDAAHDWCGQGKPKRIEVGIPLKRFHCKDADNECIYFDELKEGSDGKA